MMNKTMKTLIAGNVVAGVLFATGLVGVATAQSVQDSKPAPQAPSIDIVQAIELAKAEVPGLVIEAELDDEDGVQIYEIEIVNADGVEMEVELNAETGEILEVEEDDGKKKKHKKRS